jgi:hypothetical protein
VTDVMGSARSHVDTRDDDVVAVCCGVVVSGLQFHCSTGGANVPVVELLVGSATVYAESCDDSVRSPYGDVAGAAEDDHGHVARGGGEHHVDVAGATVQSQGPRAAQRSALLE